MSPARFSRRRSESRLMQSAPEREKGMPSSGCDRLSGIEPHAGSSPRTANAGSWPASRYRHGDGEGAQ